MNTETQYSGKKWQILAIFGLGVLAIAFVAGIWGFFGNSHSMNGSSPANTRGMMHKKTANDAANHPDKQRVIPKALVNAGEYGENIYDFAKGGDWKSAKAKLVELKQSVKDLQIVNIDSAKLTPTLKNIETAVSTENKSVTLAAANHFTLLAAELTAKFDPNVPVEVIKLDYYGREIEIWAAKKDEIKLAGTARDIRKTWDAVKQRVEANNGKNEAAKFEELVREIESAKSIPAYAKLATPILDEVDNLEKVFG